MRSSVLGPRGCPEDSFAAAIHATLWRLDAEWQVRTVFPPHIILWPSRIIPKISVESAFLTVACLASSPSVCYHPQKLQG